MATSAALATPVQRPLPGVRISATPPPAAQALPRMDVAVLVGFASTGPLHQPVVVESVDDYAAVFGPDALLAWDAQRGERLQAHLGPAVRAFFANGGRRCWVIRVARSAAAEALWQGIPLAAAQALPDVARSSRFVLPGILQVARTGAADEQGLPWASPPASPDASPLAPALAQARCEGAWADTLRVDCALLQQPLAIDGLFALDSPPQSGLRLHSRQSLQRGDLLLMGSTQAVCAYAVVEQVLAPTGSTAQADVQVLAAFERVQPQPASPASPGLDGQVGWVDPGSITGMPGSVPALLNLATGTGQVQLRMQAPLPAHTQPGPWVRWQGGGQTLWLRIDAVDPAEPLVDSPPGASPSPAPQSPPSMPADDLTLVNPALAHLHLAGPAWRELPAALPAQLGAAPRVQRLLLDLRVSQHPQSWRLTDLGLTPQHARPWWAQVDDATYYAHTDDALQARPPVDTDDPGALAYPLQAGTAAARAPAQRFPLARSHGPLPAAWLPLGVEPLFGAATTALPESATPLQRDGLARFDAELFVDPALATTPMAALLAQADAIRLLNEPVRPLLGLHASLGIGQGGLFNEASLLAVPDAVHLGWLARDPAVPPLPDAALPPPPAHWQQHRGACTQALADTARPPCACGAAGAGDTPAAGTDAPDNPDTPESTAAPALAEPDFSRFIDCRTRALPAPLLQGPAGPVPPGSYTLRWTAVVAAAEPATRYELSAARLGDFSDALLLYSGPLTQFKTAVQRSGHTLYRVRAWQGDEPSLPSNTLAVQVQEADWLQHHTDAVPPEAEATWLAIHRAALRLAGASGELLAVLAMPRHYRSAQALRYAGLLRAVRQPQPGPGPVADPHALSAGEARALSHGALYHPWLQAGSTRSGAAVGSTAAGATTPRVLPPDGAALGVLAGRALRRGAWVAPANEVLKDVLALAPAAAAADWQALQDAQINLLRADPRGLLCLSADTLALQDDAELRPISVRRLLILLRRLALRHGTRYVFEPQGPVLRRAVQRSFQELLDTLFRRGAFAGRTPEQGFRIVTDETINSARDADAGRFFIELRVAPALPMRFISVRLTQSGDRLSVAEAL